MFGACTAIGAAGSVYPPGGNSHSHLSSDSHHTRPKPVESDGGALSSARNALSRSLGSAGFVDVTMPFEDSFASALRYRPPEMEIGDLKPGVLMDLMSWGPKKLTAHPRRALAAQANVSPEAAIRLLK
jgi:hypothetical protein